MTIKTLAYLSLFNLLMLSESLVNNAYHEAPAKLIWNSPNVVFPSEVLYGVTTATIMTTTSTKTTSTTKKPSNKKNGKAKDKSTKKTKGDLEQNLAPVECDDVELERLLYDCLVIWKAYCVCEACGHLCDKWPPEETAKWNNLHGLEWRDRDNSWQWAAKCAHNATWMWRLDTFCENGFEDHLQYWFLSELAITSDHDKIVELCEYECDGLPATPSTNHIHLTTSRANFATVGLKQTPPITFKMGKDLPKTQTTNDSNTTTQHDSSVVTNDRPTLPSWMFALIGFLVAVVLILVILCILKSINTKTNRSVLEQPPDVAMDPRFNETKSHPKLIQQNSMQSFGIPTVIRQYSEDGIYQTIQEPSIGHSSGFPPNPSPIFKFPPPSQVANNESLSTKNILYQDSDREMSPLNTAPPTNDSTVYYDHVHRENHLPGFAEDKKLSYLDTKPDQRCETNSAYRVSDASSFESSQMGHEYEEY